MSRFNAFKGKKANYNFVVENDVARGTLPDGTLFLIDADKVELVSNYFFHSGDRGYIYTLKGNNTECKVMLHWLVLGHLKRPDFQVDHINRDKTDCRVSNLRAATNQQNSMNRKKSCNNTSGYKGAYFNKFNGYYMSKICVNYHQIYPYRSHNLIECAQAYNVAAKLLFGEFAGELNDVPPASETIISKVYEKCRPYILEDDSAVYATA